jgi:uncharacterized protein DUF3606
MSDDKSKVGTMDRDRVSASEPYEVEHLAQKFGVSQAEVRKAIQQAGPMRRDVEAELQKMKAGK